MQEYYNKQMDEVKALAVEIGDEAEWKDELIILARIGNTMNGTEFRDIIKDLQDKSK